MRPSPTFLVVCNHLWTDFYVKYPDLTFHENPMEVLCTLGCLASLLLMATNDQHNDTTTQQKWCFLTKNIL